jgi:hypothetical protein
MRIITPEYIRNFRLDENAKYKVLVINKNEGVCQDKIDPAKEILTGQLISQEGYIFLFECISRRNIKKRVCINKVDYIINNKIITKSE